MPLAHNSRAQRLTPEDPPSNIVSFPYQLHPTPVLDESSAFSYIYSRPRIELLFKMAAPAAGKPLQLDPKYDDYDFPTTAPVAQNGHPGHTTPEQDAQVFQLRSALEQEGHTKNLDTLTLVRLRRCRAAWLRGTHTQTLTGV